MSIQAGKYTVAAGDRAVYETESGALVWSCVCWVDQTTSITARVCLVAKDGTVQERNLQNLKDCFGWDGLDPMWLQDVEQLNNFDIVVEMEEYNGKLRPQVKWINPLGRGASAQKGNREAIAAKFGAKFRALSHGAAPAKPINLKVPVQQPKPPEPANPELPPGLLPITMGEAWEEVMIKCQMDKVKATFVWSKGIEKAGKKQSEMTNHDWAVLVSEIPVSGDIPF